MSAGLLKQFSDLREKIRQAPPTAEKIAEPVVGPRKKIYVNRKVYMEKIWRNWEMEDRKVGGVSVPGDLRVKIIALKGKRLAEGRRVFRGMVVRDWQRRWGKW